MWSQRAADANDGHKSRGSPSAVLCFQEERWHWQPPPTQNSVPTLVPLVPIIQWCWCSWYQTTDQVWREAEWVEVKMRSSSEVDQKAGCQMTERLVVQIPLWCMNVCVESALGDQNGASKAVAKVQFSYSNKSSDLSLTFETKIKKGRNHLNIISTAEFCVERRSVTGGCPLGNATWKEDVVAAGLVLWWEDRMTGNQERGDVRWRNDISRASRCSFVWCKVWQRSKSRLLLSNHFLPC